MNQQWTIWSNCSDLTRPHLNMREEIIMLMMNPIGEKMHIFCFQCYRKNPPKNETLDHYLQLRKCLTQVIWWVKQRVCRLRVGFFVVCFSVVVKSLKSTRRERVENPKKTVVKRIREVSPNWSKHSGPYWAMASMGLVYYIPTFTKIYHKNQPNVGKYIMHGLYGYYLISPVTCEVVFLLKNWDSRIPFWRLDSPTPFPQSGSADKFS